MKEVRISETNSKPRSGTYLTTLRFSLIDSITEMTEKKTTSIEPITGQPKSPMTTEKCKACHENLEDLEVNLKCDKCKDSFHIFCVELPDYELLKYLKHNNKRKFQCKNCIESLYPSELQHITKHTKNRIHSESTTQNTEIIEERNKYQRKSEDLIKIAGALRTEIEESATKIQALEQNLARSECELTLAYENIRRLERELNEERRITNFNNKSDDSDDDEETEPEDENDKIMEKLCKISEKVDQIERQQKQMNEKQQQQQHQLEEQRQLEKQRQQELQVEHRQQEDNQHRWQPPQQPIRRNITCFYCGRRGHPMRNCYHARWNRYYNDGYSRNRHNNYINANTRPRYEQQRRRYDQTRYENQNRYENQRYREDRRRNFERERREREEDRYRVSRTDNGNGPIQYTPTRILNQQNNRHHSQAIQPYF